MDKSDIQETLVSLYLRLNGYFVSGFVVHASHRNMTEMDVLAVRFPQQKEPEREVQSCAHIAAPSGSIDFVVGEVKGGQNKANFNLRFRENPQAIRTVLNRFGAFDEEEIGRLVDAVPRAIDPAAVGKTQDFPTLDVCKGGGRLRFILFAPDQTRKDGKQGPYVFGDDLLGFAWLCFRPEQQRPLCDVRYNYELWGPQFTRMVRYFKDPSRSVPGSIDDLYEWHEQ